MHEERRQRIKWYWSTMYFYYSFCGNCLILWTILFLYKLIRLFTLFKKVKQIKIYTCTMYTSFKLVALSDVSVWSLIIIYTLFHSRFFLQKSWMVQKRSSNLSVSIIKIRKWCHWPRVLDTSLWGWNFLFFIIFYLSSFTCLTGYCSCDLVLYVILNFFLCESNVLVLPSITFTSSVSCVILIFLKLHH